MQVSYQWYSPSDKKIPPHTRRRLLRLTRFENEIRFWQEGRKDKEKHKIASNVLRNRQNAMHTIKTKFDIQYINNQKNSLKCL